MVALSCRLRTASPQSMSTVELPERIPGDAGCGRSTAMVKWQTAAKSLSRARPVTTPIRSTRIAEPAGRIDSASDRWKRRTR